MSIKLIDKPLSWHSLHDCKPWWLRVCGLWFSEPFPEAYFNPCCMGQYTKLIWNIELISSDFTKCGGIVIGAFKLCITQFTYYIQALITDCRPQSWSSTKSGWPEIWISVDCLYLILKCSLLCWASTYDKIGNKFVRVHAVNVQLIDQKLIQMIRILWQKQYKTVKELVPILFQNNYFHCMYLLDNFWTWGYPPGYTSPHFPHDFPEGVQWLAEISEMWDMYMAKLFTIG